MAQIKFFIYGTLKENGDNNGVISKIGKKLSTGLTVKKYPMFSDGNMYIQYPYLINKPDEGKFIKGEIWEVHHSNIKKIDSFESDLFKKGDILVYNELGEVVPCKVYFKSQKVNYSDKELIDEFN